MNLKAVTRLIGINENTLRAWERRYQAVSPDRDAQGRRDYSAKEVERLKYLWALVKEGHSIGLIAKLPTTEIKKLIKTSLSPEQPILTSDSQKTEELLKEILTNLGKFNLEKMNISLQRARFELSCKEIVVNLIHPLLARVGGMIMENKLTITQEHILSALLRDYVGQLHQSLAPYDFSSRPNSKSAILTTREGDLHEFGILLSTIICNLYRYRTFYLGPNMPLEDLIEACLQLKVEYVVLGVMALPKKREIITAQDYIAELDQRLPRKITFCLGGSQHVDIEGLKSERKFVIFSDLNEFDRFFSERST